MADALVSPILELLTKIVAQQVQEKVNLVVGVKKQVNKLQSNVIDIQLVLEDAERKQLKDKAVRVWLDNLKDVCYDIDDVLDEWSYAILTWEMDEENTRSLKKMRCSFMRSPCFGCNQVVQRRDIALKIKAVSEKLDEIAKEKAMYGFELYKATDHELPRLTSTSLVDESSVCGRDDEKKIVVSKLLAEKNECLTVGDNNLGEAIVETSIERVRHLSMMLSGETSFPSSIHRAKGLRSLLIGKSVYRWDGAALPDVIKQLTCIRSLNLSGSSIKEIPKEVGKLIHLRHLNLKGCGVLESLPETMCDLCNLQSLDVRWCTFLNELPQAIVKLIKLRHLRIYESCVAFIPKGIERLTCLRTLDWFAVCGGENLRGGIEDAVEAQLKNKKRLLCLELHFDVNHEDDILIEVLQPPSDLEKLSIHRYGGTILPNWMMALTRLQELLLRDCGNVEVLPPLGRLPNLESLVLFRVGVRRLDAGFLGIEEVENANINEGQIARVAAFPKLKRLQIWGLSKLEEWDGIERRVGEERIFEQMQEDKLEPDVYTYNALMEAYSRAGFPYGAAEIFSLMRHMGCDPDRASYNIMVDAYGRAGLHEDAQAVFNEMKRLGITPTMKSHMLLLCAYSKARNVTKCEEIVNQMSESGLEPDTFVLNSMMHLYGQLGQFEKMEEVLTAMEKGPYEADISTYNILINIYGRAGFFERMEGIFQSLTTKNLKPDVVTWTSRLGAYSRKKLYRKCLEIFEEMIDGGCHPDGGTAKVLLSACSSEDQME
ncbi:TETRATRICOPEPTIDE REPEAT (TPR)-LIKE SUPERFAMILY PROTEIN-RELATED [Salix purpurea]|uniref:TETRATRICOPEPTIDE REPEAT (TPR)-LIKE SUPERFAMILY PROTEIN-RELATED n=1 Tax=Salix purpurea TaxID=77065 RepID=A0A9Q0VGH0_SALPP|nr:TETRATRICOPEPTIDE REPEAT (TPR)-LIKE SUPERFAMILY PROTEIN-RELATED [Salix purpurea]